MEASHVGAYDALGILCLCTTPLGMAPPRPPLTSSSLSSLRPCILAPFDHVLQPAGAAFSLPGPRPPANPVWRARPRRRSPLHSAPSASPACISPHRLPLSSFLCFFTNGHQTQPFLTVIINAPSRPFPLLSSPHRFPPMRDLLDFSAFN